MPEFAARMKGARSVPHSYEPDVLPRDRLPAGRFEFSYRLSLRGTQ